MHPRPPKWINWFLEFYCRPEMLEDIQGDAFELYSRTVKKSRWKANVQFTWNVIRYFRWRNIRRPGPNNNFTLDMINNIFTVAIRNFFRRPGSTVINVAALAVSFTAAFLVAIWILFELSFDQFHDQPGRIFTIKSHVNANGTIETYTSARVNSNLASLPEVESKSVVISGPRWPNELCFRADEKSGNCVYQKGIYADEPFFRMFNFPIVDGDPNPLSKPDNIAMSEQMANLLFGDENPIGKTIKLDNYYVVTIASLFKNVPSNSSLQFDFVLHRAMFMKMRGYQPDQFERDFQTIYFKTKVDVSEEVLTQKLNEPSLLTDDLRADKLSYSAFALANARLHGEFKDGKSIGGRILYVRLFGLIALMVVAMAVINFVALTTARAGERAKEIGVRKVTGAGRFGIVLQFIGEAFLVVLVATSLAALSTQLMMPFFNRLLGENLNVSLVSPPMMLGLFGFLLLVSLVAGIYPAFIMSSYQPATVLKGVGRVAPSGRGGFRTALLVVQVAASVAIIIFTGILFLQLQFIRTKNLGLDKENILHIEPSYQLLKKYDAFKAELLTNPNVRSVTATAADPLNLQFTTTGVKWPGMPPGMNAPFNLLGTNYEVADVFGIKLLEGRPLGDKAIDTVNNEVVLTKSAAQLMDLKEPLGATISIGEATCTVIGVVEDFHSASLHETQLPVILYRHNLLQCSRLYVKYSGDPSEAVERIEGIYKKFEPMVTMRYDFVDDTFNSMYKTEATSSRILLIFTGIAIVIAVVGIAGLAAFNMARRKREIGIKRVFGASSIHILSMLNRDFVAVVALASIIAMPCAWYASHTWLSGFAYHIEMPWWVFVASLTGILALTILLITGQAWGMVRTNPTDSLRSE